MTAATYMCKAFLPCMLGVAFVYWSFRGAREKPESFLQALRGNAVFFLLPAYPILALTVLEVPSSINWMKLPVICSVVVWALLILLASLLGRWSLAHIMFGQGSEVKVIFLVFAGFAVILATKATGNNHATLLIKGQSHDSAAISLTIKDGTEFLKNKQLILIAYSNNNYYVVERQNPVPKRVATYIVPGSEVKSVVLDRNPIISKESNSPERKTEGDPKPQTSH